MSKTIFIILSLVFILATMALATFLSSRSTNVSTFKIKTDENTILLGISPWGDPKKVKEQYSPLISYLSERLGKKIQFLSMEDYDVAVENLLDGNIDISVMAPASYVKAKAREPGIQYITTSLMNNGGVLRATYKGYLVTLKSKYNGLTFDELLKNPKKYKIGFVSLASASGWAYPAAMMKKRGVDPESAFKKVIFFDNHQAVIDALISGKVDVAATWDGNIDEATSKYGDIFWVVYRSADIPGSAWVASKNFDPAITKKLAATLEEINGSEELKSTLLKDAPDKGWTRAPDSFYDSVREVVKYVGDFK